MHQVACFLRSLGKFIENPDSGTMLAVALVFCSCSATWPTGLAVSVDDSAPRPNVLVLLIDDMGYGDLHAYGSQNHSTPHLDALIQSGMKFTSWISAAAICTPSRAALQTGRYPIRTGCMGNNEKVRVVPTPSNPHGLDPAAHLSLAAALKHAGYRTGMSGKWHLGINSNDAGEPQDHRFTPIAHSYETYLGAPYTNCPMCEMDGDGISQKIRSGPNYCFMTANDTVVQQPLRLQNFTSTITAHAIDFLALQATRQQQAVMKGEDPQPWYFFMAWFHVHTPLFTNRTNGGRSGGGKFGDNVEELDDSAGEIMAALRTHGFDQNTLIFLTSDNGPYQEEGWENTGRTNVYNADGSLQGRLRGGKGQVFEGGIRMPGAVVWPGVVSAGSTSDTLVSTMDIFPTALAAAGVSLGANYTVDGKDMAPVLRDGAAPSQHRVFFHYCGFKILAARVDGRFKVFWATQKWYTNDKKNASICLECCNGVNPWSAVTGSHATELCGCEDSDIEKLPENAPIVYDMHLDRLELQPLTAANWPAAFGNMTYAEVVSVAAAAKQRMEAEVHPKPSIGGAGTCTAGLPDKARQPCCPSCAQRVGDKRCETSSHTNCSCNAVPAAWLR